MLHRRTSTGLENPSEKNCHFPVGIPFPPRRSPLMGIIGASDDPLGGRGPGSGLLHHSVRNESVRGKKGIHFYKCSNPHRKTLANFKCVVMLCNSLRFEKFSFYWFLIFFFLMFWTSKIYHDKEKKVEFLALKATSCIFHRCQRRVIL